MEVDVVMRLLAETLNPDRCDCAELKLMEMHSVKGFPSLLLQIVVAHEVELPLRQAAVLYLKNLIIRHWNEGECPLMYYNPKLNTPPFNFHEEDRALIRDSIMESTFRAPPLLCSHLGLCMNSIIRADFPNRWPQIVDKINYYLQSPNSNHWSGALLALFQLVKRFEYTDNLSFSDALKILLPDTYKLMIKIVGGTSDDSLLLEKQILKIYFTLIEYTLPVKIITKEVFSQWMEILHIEATKPLPEYPPDMDDEEKARMPFWKMKKWTVRILKQLFYKYGSPNTSTDTELANWYLTTFTGGILEALLKILDQYRNKIFISPKVMIHTIGYIKQGLSYSHSWKFLKPHMFAIIRDVVFPIMCHNDEIEDVFTNDPKTYLRYKTDIFSDMTYICTPVPAVTSFLIKTCKKRKNMLLQVVQFCVHVISDNKSDYYNIQQKDGALHMIGSLSKTLMKRNEYKDRIEEMLVMCVLPEVQSSHDHMRARAFWVVNQFAETNIANEQLLAQLTNLMIDTLLNDACLPVKFEAAMGIQSFVIDQPSVSKYIIPKVNEITLEILNLLRLTENEVLTTVVQILLNSFVEQLTPVAKNVIAHLATTFVQIFGDCQISDEKAITSTAILQTIESVITLLMDNEEVFKSLEEGVLSVIFHIFHYGLIDFYEEAFSLVYHLTYKSISPALWQVFEKIYEIFQDRGIEYFTDMMPALHNYITKDTETFLSNEVHVVAIFNMCKAILDTNFEEDPGCYAAKLLEIILLQCKGRVDNAVPNFVFIALSRLTKEIRTSELRVMCLQVVIAALYYNPSIWFEILKNINELQLPAHSDVSNWFVKLCINDANCFLGIHDRKLAIIGFCILLGMEPHKRATILSVDDVSKIMSACMLLFDGLKKARECKDALEEEIESESDDNLDDGVDFEALSSDADEPNQDSVPNPILDKQQELIKTSFTSNPDDDSDYNDDLSNVDVAPLEIYKTPLDSSNYSVDEYAIFYDIIKKLTTTEEQFYMTLTSKLTETELVIMKDVIRIATERGQKQFGYQFV